jgi:hypothetical protein
LLELDAVLPASAASCADVAAISGDIGCAVSGIVLINNRVQPLRLPGLFAAYNAGPEGTPLPAKTRVYLRTISSDVGESELATDATTGSGGSGSARTFESGR